jgi:aryl-alcohol dehydrogenase-like predicted oxidoreductase
MDHTTLGRSGLRVSVAGLGCGGFSRLGMSTGKTEAESVALVRLAIDHGITLIDTAANYGTEEIVARRSAPFPARASWWRPNARSSAAARCILRHEQSGDSCDDVHAR